MGLMEFRVYRAEGGTLSRDPYPKTGLLMGI